MTPVPIQPTAGAPSWVYVLPYFAAVASTLWGIFEAHQRKKARIRGVELKLMLAGARTVSRKTRRELERQVDGSASVPPAPELDDAEIVEEITQRIFLDVADDIRAEHERRDREKRELEISDREYMIRRELKSYHDDMESTPPQSPDAIERRARDVIPPRRKR